MPVTAAEFRSALRHFPAGVTVVTTRDATGRPQGLTATAFTAVSLHPPLVLVCVDHEASAHRALAEHGWFGINILGAHQEPISRHFATSQPDKFAGIAFSEGRAGVPILDAVVAALECRVVHVYAGGDHTIFVGQVEAISIAGGAPLVYHRGRYHRLPSDEEGQG